MQYKSKLLLALLVFITGVGLVFTMPIMAARAIMPGTDQKLTVASDVRDSLFLDATSISKRIAFPIAAHGLRRTFATLNAEEGRPLHLIQKALGHSDITTTQGYLMSEQEAVIEAM